MSTDIKKQGEPSPDDGAPDPIQNLKSEFSRKQSNLEGELSKTNQALQELMSRLNAPAAKAEPQKKLSDLILDDTEQAVNVIEERITSKINKQQVEASRFQQAAQEIYNHYPEAADQSSELYKRTIALYKEAGEISPAAMKAAAHQAALELDVTPKSKRSKAKDPEADGFTASSGSRATPPRGGSGKEAAIDEATEAFAAMFPKYINLEDKDTRKRLATKHGRKTYGRWG